MRGKIDKWIDEFGRVLSGNSEHQQPATNSSQNLDSNNCRQPTGNTPMRGQRQQQQQFRHNSAQLTSDGAVPTPRTTNSRFTTNSFLNYLFPRYDYNMSNRNGCRTRTASGPNQASNSNQPQNAATADKIDISHIKDLGDIDKLSARQLKTVLAVNCVEYRNIIEMEVLRAKVVELWIDYNARLIQRNNPPPPKQTSNNPNKSQDSTRFKDDEDQLCKICMDNEIDCVLLDCGHQFTCVTCGRKLAECSICRRNVIRVVKTFKA